MMETVLERIATALERIANKELGPAPEPRKRAPKEPAAPAAASAPEPEVETAATPTDDDFLDTPAPKAQLKEITKDDVKEAMVLLRKKIGDTPALKHFKDWGGADTLTSLSKDKYAYVYSQAVKLL